MHKKRGKKYFSITTPKGMREQWWPLQSHQQMETRPCYYANSRIHKLACGHTVAVARDAEPCAANCANALVQPKNCFGSPVPAQYAPTLVKIRESIFEGFNAFAATAANANDVVRNNVWLDVLDKVWRDQEAKLAPHPDLISGDFYCSLCSTDFHRAAIPAFELPDAPYYCFVVGKDEHDVAIIHELERGVRPHEMKHKGRKVHGDPDVMRRVREGRITRQRVEEKQTVTDRLRTETMLEEWETLGM